MSNLAGQTLNNRYFLRELKESGGSADVYLAWDQMRSTRMAVKVLRWDENTSAEFFQIFAKEAEILRHLEHPNIVRLYEFERHGSLVYFVLDWIEGSDLRKLIKARSSPLSPGESYTILNPVCIALDYAHKNRIYHCDVKPGNILLHVDGRILLTDFGVASFGSSEWIGGTLHYMAPEQFIGDEIDARTDVYSTGVTLFSILTGGKVPFKGDDPSSHGTTVKERVAWEHQNLQVPDLRQFNPDLPESLEGVVKTALQKAPERRYASTLEFRDALWQACKMANTGSHVETNLRTMFPARKKESNQPPAGKNIFSELFNFPAKFNEPARKDTPKREKPKPVPSAETTSNYLLGTSGEWRGRRQSIPTSGLTIGRGSTSQLQISEQSVSRLHATVLITRQGVVIRDENSSFGTYVNGQRIYGAILLRHGDIIQIGYGPVFEFRKR